MATSLQFIKSVEITSSQSTTNVDNIFSTNYDVYKIVLKGICTVGTTDLNLNARLIDNSGSVISDNEYDYAVLQLKSGSSFTQNKNTNFSRIDRISFSDQSPESQGCVLYVYNPNDSSSYTFLNWQETHSRGGGGGGFRGIAVHKVAETIRGINFFDVYTDRPYDKGTIVVYGIK